jgi:hypothetical protein
MYPCKRLDGTICQPCQHLTIKLETQSQQFGTINILLDQPLPDEDLALLTLIGSQISEIVSNAWLRLKLAEKESARQALLSALVKAQEDERARLAHELHDGAGQTLTSLLLRLKSLEKKAPDEKFRLAILNVCDTFSETIETVREISHQLRPVILEELGLETALKSLLHQMATQIGLEVDFDYQLPDEMISDDLEATLYRVVQEALTNITRHARASRIRLQLLADEEALHLYIEDNGVGFDPEQEALRDGRGRFGLLGMQERVEVLGGSFEVFTAPEQGTCITVLVPWILAGIA